MDGLKECREGLFWLKDKKLQYVEEESDEDFEHVEHIEP